jgi:hypothetical protein
VSIFNDANSSEHPSKKNYKKINEYKTSKTIEGKFLLIEEIDTNVLNRMKILLSSINNKIEEIKIYKYKYNKEQYCIQREFINEFECNKFIKRYQKNLNNILIQVKRDNMLAYFKSRGYELIKM